MVRLFRITLLSTINTLALVLFQMAVLDFMVSLIPSSSSGEKGTVLIIYYLVGVYSSYIIAPVALLITFLLIRLLSKAQAFRHSWLLSKEKLNRDYLYSVVVAIFALALFTLIH